jgi:ribosome-binding protein aMBF1 (putative translation factor)
MKMKVYARSTQAQCDICGRYGFQANIIQIENAYPIIVCQSCTENLTKKLGIEVEVIGEKIVK